MKTQVSPQYRAGQRALGIVKELELIPIVSDAEMRPNKNNEYHVTFRVEEKTVKVVVKKAGNAEVFISSDGKKRFTPLCYVVPEDKAEIYRVLRKVQGL